MKKKINLYSLVTGLFFFSIPANPIVSNYFFYFIGTINVILFVSLLLKNKVKVIFTKFEIFYLLFIMWNIMSLIWTLKFDKYVIKYSLIYFSFIVSSMRLYILTIKNENKADKLINHFFKWFITGTFIVSIFCLIYEHPFYPGAERLGTYVFREPYGTRMMYTYNLEISIFYLMFKIFNQKNNKIKWGLIFSFFVFCIALTGTRKIFIGIIIYILSMIFLKNKKKIIKLLPKIFTLIIVVFIAYILIMKIPVLYNTIGKRYESGFSYFSGDAAVVDNSMKDRNAMVEYAIFKYKERPLIGNGSNVFHHLFNAYYGQDLYAHNTFAELLCDVGIIGFTLYYINYIWIIISKYNGKYKYMFISSILAILVLDYWTISYYRIQFLAFLELALLYSVYSKKSNFS